MMSDFKLSAPVKRAEQKQRWQDSDTNKESTVPKKSSRVRFSFECSFLAACSAGDKEEVLKLVQDGHDVNAPCLDGLSTLHQACIDNNLSMVKFLIKLGADVNLGDNEGWTPLHATASCGFYDIAQYLVDQGANLSALNNECELPVDLAEPGPTKELLQNEMQKKGIDYVSARAKEENLLLEHATKWFTTKSPEADVADSRTGATPLHIAAAKGYLKVMHILLDNCGVDVDPVDSDGWSPLHASAYWGQPDAATILVQHGADMDIENFAGQTCFDVAEADMIEHLQDLKDKRENIVLPIHNKQKRRPPVPEDLPSKLKKVEVQIDNKFDSTNNNKKPNDKNNALNLNSLPVTVEGKPPKVGGGVSHPSANESSQTEDEPSWRHASRQKPQSSLNDKEMSTNQTENDVILRRTPSDEENISPPNKPKKDGFLPTLTSTPRRSFVPPVRDEESETQRKAHAKRVRETRRSTQGVTLDEIKSAEQLVKKKNSLQNDKNDLAVTIKKDTIDIEQCQNEVNHRGEPADNDKSNKVPIEPVDTETTVTVALPRSPSAKKDDGKEAEIRVPTQAAQNVIQRRKRPKRRSTGVVTFGLEEINPDPSTEGTESGSEMSEPENVNAKKSEENAIDYKSLWESCKLENKKLQEILTVRERDLVDVRQNMEDCMSRLAAAGESEKREKRAMERKMSEMEEELKCLHNLQTENMRLKDENGALIRVISKLSK